MSSRERKCQVCQKANGQKCAGCHVIYYCSKEHQKMDWKRHRTVCRPYKVCENKLLGRHLVSTRQIRLGEIVLQEAPLIWGPSQITVPVCLGCGKTINADNSTPCTKCGWPVCDESCQNSPNHVPECHYTAKRGDKMSIKNFEMTHPSYQCITVLRCLYHKQYSPEIWKKLDSLESHCDKRKQTEKYENDRATIARFVRQFFKLQDVFSEEEILRVCGIVNINGHEVPLTEPANVSIYESTSMFEHSCRANCCKSFTSKGNVLISAGETIPKGAHLSICYTDPLWSTPDRRHHLHETKFFWCNCVRCSDPTEFKTHFSLLNCNDARCDGYLSPKTFLEISDETSSEWGCRKCPNTIPAYEVQRLSENLGKELAAMKRGSVESCKSFIKNNRHILPKHHHYITDVSFALIQLIGQEDGIIRVSEEDLLLKISTCRSLMQLFRKIAPAEKRILGIVLFELQGAVVENGRRKAALGLQEEFYSSLMETKSILYEVVELLKHEPEKLTEGKIYKQALKNLKEIETALMVIHVNTGDCPM